jgi:3-oxoadipate enol-lactonase
MAKSIRRSGEPIVTPVLPDVRQLDLGERGVLTIRFSTGPTDRRKARKMPPLVLIHGWTVSANLNWFRLYDRIAERHAFVAWDQRGHGAGLRPETFTLEDCADDVIAVADALGWDQVVPVGYSMGGTIAQLVAQRHPTRVAGLVLCSTAAVFQETRGDEFFFESLLGGAVKALNAAPKFLVDRLPGRFRSPNKDSPLADWMAAEWKDHHAGLIAQAGHAVGRFRSEPWLSELSVPTAVVVTTEDDTVPATRQRQLAALIPGATEHPVALDHRAAVNSPDMYWPAFDAALASVARRQSPLLKGSMAAVQARSSGERVSPKGRAHVEASQSVQHLFVSGRVQNVGFRDSMQRRAQELGVKGWVRNLDDGRVEAVLAGARERVDELLDWARTGPPMANVTELRAKARTMAELRRQREHDSDGDNTALDSTFEVRPSSKPID